MSKTYKQIFYALMAFNFYLPIAHATESHSGIHFVSLLKSSFVMSLSLGPSWETAGQAQTLNLTPDVIKTYTANRPSNTFPSGELFLGLKNALPKQLESQIGLALVATGNATLSGDIWDDADPTFNNYIYQYKVSHTALALKGKLLSHCDLPIIPWISASLGMGFNRAYGFNNTPTISEAVQTPNFKSHTTTVFIYTIGIGIQRQLNTHWQMGAGYEFSDWGKHELDSMSGQSSNQRLSLSHLYTNSILFNLTYFA